MCVFSFSFMSHSFVVYDCFSVKEMAEAKERWTEIRHEQSAFGVVMNDIRDKNSLLHRMSGKKAINLAEIEQKWEFLDGTVSAFDDMLAEQRNELVLSMEKQVKDFVSEMESFASKWQALKPNRVDEFSGEIARDILRQIEEWRSELNAHCVRMSDLQRECRFFEVSFPDIPHLGIVCVV